MEAAALVQSYSWVSSTHSRTIRSAGSPAFTNTTTDSYKQASLVTATARLESSMSRAACTDLHVVGEPQAPKLASDARLKLATHSPKPKQRPASSNAAFMERCTCQHHKQHPTSPLCRATKECDRITPPSKKPAACVLNTTGRLDIPSAATTKGSSCST
jgi:hypothetical protein